LPARLFDDSEELSVWARAALAAAQRAALKRRPKSHKAKPEAKKAAAHKSAPKVKSAAKKKRAPRKRSSS
jgi:DNA transformation protein